MHRSFWRTSVRRSLSLRDSWREIFPLAEKAVRLVDDDAGFPTSISLPVNTVGLTWHNDSHGRQTGFRGGVSH